MCNVAQRRARRVGIDHRTFYEGKTVLVTGGAGAIGNNLVKTLADLGAGRVWVLDNLSSGTRWLVPERSNITFVRGDILEEHSLRQVFAAKPQVVFHLAALFANQNSVDHPEDDLAVNGLGTLKVLQQAINAGVLRVIFASSSSAVYNGMTMPLVEEQISLDVTTPYQATKLLGELYCYYFQHHFGLSTVRVRFFNSYGPGEFPGPYRNVIPNFIYRALRGEPLIITGTGEETRDWTYVEDVVDGLLRMGSVPEASGKVFNLGAGRETTVRELVGLVNRIAGNCAGVECTARRAWDVSTRRVASIDKATHILGYRPRIQLEMGLQATVAWFRCNWQEITSSVEALEAI